MTTEAHKLFVPIAQKNTSIGKDDVKNCLWDETHNQMVDWYNEILECLDKIK